MNRSCRADELIEFKPIQLAGLFAFIVSIERHSRAFQRNVKRFGRTTTTTAAAATIGDDNENDGSKYNMCTRWCGAHKLKKVVYVYSKMLTQQSYNSDLAFVVGIVSRERLGVSLPKSYSPKLRLLAYSPLLVFLVRPLSRFFSR